MTRGEPRPVHITLIATCRVYSAVVVIRRIIPGLSPRLRSPGRPVTSSQRSFVSRDLPVPTEGGVCRARQPAQKHTRPMCGPTPGGRRRSKGELQGGGLRAIMMGGFPPAALRART